MSDKDYDQAVAKQAAVDLIPNARTPAASMRMRWISLQGQRQTRRTADHRGTLSGRENTLKLALDDRYNPRYKDAIIILARLETPDYYNKTITPNFRARSSR